MEMSWLQILVLAFGNLAWMLPVFFWVRSESRADARKADADNKELRRELIEVMRAMETEMRDFHGRLCAIEERRQK